MATMKPLGIACGNFHDAIDKAICSYFGFSRRSAAGWQPEQSEAGLSDSVGEFDTSLHYSSERPPSANLAPGSGAIIRRIESRRPQATKPE